MKGKRLHHGPMPGAKLGQILDPLWRAVVDHPLAVILVIALISVFLGYCLTLLRIDPSLEAMSVDDSPAKLAYREFLDYYGADEFIVVAAKVNHGDLFTPENLRAVKGMSDALAANGHFYEVVSLTSTPLVRPTEDGVFIGSLFDEVPTDPKQIAKIKKRAMENPLLKQSVISDDGTTCVFYAFPRLDQGDTTQLRIEIYDAAVAAANEHLQDFEVHFEGIPSVKRYMALYIQRAIVIFGGVSAIMLALVLFIIFRTIRGVILPGLTVGLALVWTLGIMGVTGGVLDSISALLFALIMVVGIGDTVHIVVHYLEEFFLLGDRKKALLATMRRMFMPCLLTSVTTAVGFFSLVTIHIPPIRAFGIYAATGVLSAFVISILLAPAILVLLPDPPQVQRRLYETGFLGRRLEWAASFNRRRPKIILLVAALIAVFSILGIFRIRVETRVSEFFHPWSPIVKGYKFLEENLTPPIPLEILLQGKEDTFKKPETWKWIDELREDILKDPKIARADSYGDFLKELNWAFTANGAKPGKREIPDSEAKIAQFSMLFQDASPETFERFMGNNFDRAHITLRMYDSSSAEQAALIDEVRRKISKHIPPDVKWKIAGGTVIFVSAVEELTKGQVRSLTIALAIITLMITLIFRSVKIGLLSMVPNVLPIIVMLGLMGWLNFPLDTNTVMIGPITLGIAVDDTIHYIMRFRREAREGKSYPDAMSSTLLTTGRALVSTSIILALGFGITILSSFRPQSILGGLGGATILIALVADLMVLPAIMLTFFKSGTRQN